GGGGAFSFGGTLPAILPSSFLVSLPSVVFTSALFLSVEGTTATAGRLMYHQPPPAPANNTSTKSTAIMKPEFFFRRTRTDDAPMAGPRPRFGAGAGASAAAVAPKGRPATG